MKNMIERVRICVAAAGGHLADLYLTHNNYKTNNRLIKKSLKVPFTL